MKKTMEIMIIVGIFGNLASIYAEPEDPSDSHIKDLVHAVGLEYETCSKILSTFPRNDAAVKWAVIAGLAGAAADITYQHFSGRAQNPSLAGRILNSVLSATPAEEILQRESIPPIKGPQPILKVTVDNSDTDKVIREVFRFPAERPTGQYRAAQAVIEETIFDLFAVLEPKLEIQKADSEKNMDFHRKIALSHLDRDWVIENTKKFRQIPKPDSEEEERFIMAVMLQTRLAGYVRPSNEARPFGETSRDFGYSVPFFIHIKGDQWAGARFDFAGRERFRGTFDGEMLLAKSNQPIKLFFFRTDLKSFLFKNYQTDENIPDNFTQSRAIVLELNPYNNYDSLVEVGRYFYRNNYSTEWHPSEFPQKASRNGVFHYEKMGHVIW